MHDYSRPPLPKYAKYLPDAELSALEGQCPAVPPQWGPRLKTASVVLSLLCVNTTIYLIVSLVFAPHTSYHNESVGAAEITWVLFGLLPGLSALICWAMYRSSMSTQG